MEDSPTNLPDRKILALGNKKLIIYKVAPVTLVILYIYIQIECSCAYTPPLCSDIVWINTPPRLCMYAYMYAYM